jgi:hypothetical protein
MSDYVVLFDISRDAYTEWTVGLFGLGIVASGVLAAFWFDESWKKVAGLWVALAGLLLTGLIIGLGWNDYFRLRDAYRNGRFAVAEGRVEQFQRDDGAGDSPQTFVVSGHSFEVWMSRGSPAFHKTVSAGGPDLRGKCVRMLYTDRNEIIWLGIRACDETDN